MSWFSSTPSWEQKAQANRSRSNANRNRQRHMSSANTVRRNVNLKKNNVRRERQLEKMGLSLPANQRGTNYTQRINKSRLEAETGTLSNNTQSAKKSWFPSFGSTRHRNRSRRS